MPFGLSVSHFNLEPKQFPRRTGCAVQCPQADALIDGKARGNQSKLNDSQREALVAIVESGPIPATHGIVRWRLIDLAQWLYKEFTVSIENGSAKVCHGSGGIVLLRAE